MTSTKVLNIAGEVIGGKWRLSILFILQEKPLRFSEIKELMPGCSVKVLSSILKEMSTYNLLIRKQYETIPVRVTYELSPDMKGFVQNLQKMYGTWCQFLVKNHAVLHIDLVTLDQIRKEIM